MLNAVLVVVGGDVLSHSVSLNRLPLVIGRSQSADLILAHPLVSRRHCIIEEAGGQLRVRDLSSRNGTFVGRDRVDDAALLPPGGLLTVGTVTFRAVYGSAALPQVAGADDTTRAHAPHSDTVGPHRQWDSPMAMPLAPVSFVHPAADSDVTHSARTPTRPGLGGQSDEPEK